MASESHQERITICTELEAEVLHPRWRSLQEDAPLGLQLVLKDTQQSLLAIMRREMRAVTDAVHEYGFAQATLTESDAAIWPGGFRWSENVHNMATDSCWHVDNFDQHSYIYGLCIPPQSDAKRSARTGLAALPSVIRAIGANAHLLPKDVLREARRKAGMVFHPDKFELTPPMKVVNYFGCIRQAAQDIKKENVLFTFLRAMNAHLEERKQVAWVPWMKGALLLFSSQWKKGNTSLLHAREVIDHEEAAPNLLLKRTLLQ